MSHQVRLDALKARHQALEDAIAEEETHPQPDEDKLHSLKKQKLKIKDEIAGHNAR